MRVPRGRPPVSVAVPTSSGKEMTSASEWQDRVGQSWAREWQRTDRSFGPLTDRVVDTARERPYRVALDIGCGAGELTVRLAGAAPASEHLGIDISENLLAIASERTRAMPNARVQLADAASWSAKSGERPDLLVSRHGVMFFSDPVAAFAHLREQSAPSARLVFSCFRQREENVWVRELASVLAQDAAPADPRAPGPFAFGDRDYVADLLGEAGWQGIEFTQVDYPMVAGQGADALGDAVSYFRSIGPTARALAQLEGRDRDAALTRLSAMLETHQSGDTVSLPASCWIVTATNPR